MTIRRTFFARLAPALLLLVLVGSALAATDRFNTLGHKLMCTCGCNEVLLECNHVGCRNSEEERARLHADIDSGMSDDQIFKDFAARYGAIVLAAPMRGGFDNVAWIMPFAVLALAIIGTIFLILHWRKRNRAAIAASPAPTAPSAAAQSTGDSLRDRIRKETEL